MLPTTTNRTPERAEFLSDVITTAVEGGIGYWSQVSGYHWWSPTLEGGSAEHIDGIANAYVTVHELGDDPEDAGNKVQKVGVEDVARALTLIRAGDVTGLGPNARRDIIDADRENDCGDIDAGDCDIIVQVAMFGEVVYG